MVEIISKISRGTKMDQIYVSKNRNPEFEVGSYVAISPALKKQAIKPYYYRVSQLEPIKTQIISEIFEFLSAENVIITGSFLEKGFNLEDIDIIVINGAKQPIESFVKKKFGMVAHIISTSYDELRKGLNTD